jgi:hypothetical protein
MWGSDNVPIRILVEDPSWQKLRKSFLGTWKTHMQENLVELRKYLGGKPWKDVGKLRRVQNLLGALKRGGFVDGRIDLLIDEIKRERSEQSS